MKAKVRAAVIQDVRGLFLVLAMVVNCAAFGLAAGVPADVSGVGTGQTESGQTMDLSSLDGVVKAIEGLPGGAGKIALETAQSMLTATIMDARDRATPQAEPMPANIRSMLAEFYPAEILDKVKWMALDGSHLTLDSAIFLLDRQASAITLDHVVIFRNRAAGLSDWKTWAHELVHVEQYEVLGVEGFARLYVRSFGQELEPPAYNQANRIEQKLKATEGVNTGI